MTDLTPGGYWFEAPCPLCGEREQLYADVSVVLKVPSDDVASLALKTKSKPAHHACRQTRISLANVSGVGLFTVDTSTGEISPDAPS